MDVRRLAVTVLAAATLCPAVPARAIPAQHALTIAGSRTSYAVLKVTKKLTYDLDAARVDYAGGRYGGFAIADDAATLWSVYIDPRVPTLRGHSWTGTLKPGRYKVRLFTDAQRVVVTIPWSGPDVTLSPETPLDAAVDVERAVAPGTGTMVAAVIPQHSGSRARTSALAWFEAAVSPAIVLRGCLAPTATSCARAQIAVTSTGSGTAVNAYGVSFSDDRRTKGLYVRGEVSGLAVGILTVLSLRYYP